MKSILLNVSQHAPMDAALYAAVNLCHTFDANLICLQATPADELDCGTRGDGVEITEYAVEAIYQQQELQRVRLEQGLRLKNVRWDWHRVNQLPVIAIAEEALVCDIVVVGLSDFEGSVKARTLVSELAATIQAPILAVPETRRAFECRSTAVVAWNGSNVAMHALRDCLPILAQARRIVIATVDGRDVERPATVAAEYLSRQGIRSELQNIKRESRHISMALIEQCEAIAAIYLVVGAYGHSRFRETILGGVTRDLINSARVPLLLAH